MRQIEILAPAGSMPALKAAVFAGADAVYLGGRKFGARAYAENFSEEELLQVIDFVHLYDKKVYLTVNTLMKEKEINQNLFSYLKPLVEHGLDAVIVQDLGAVYEIHQWFPMLAIHASTQMTLTAFESIQILADCGVSRIVTSRELSLCEIKDIRKHSNVEIESFVHGALCFCYSGQCLFSSMIGGRSGNRGRCAQPCRMKYKVKGRESCIMSMKDMCTLELIPELVEAGIDSFKIEGRMKGPEYTAYTSYLYRKYTDKYLELGKNVYGDYLERHRRQIEEEKKHLLDLYNRGEFTSGYYQFRNGKNMLSEERPSHNGLEIGMLEKVEKRRVFLRLTEDVHAQDILEIRGKGPKDTYEFTVKESHKKGTLLPSNYSQGCKLHTGQKVYRTKNNNLLQNISMNWIEKEKKIPLQGRFIATKDRAIEFTVNDKKVSCTIRDQRPEAAKKQPSTKEEVQKRLKKTGNTPFYFENLEIIMDEDVFLPVAKINEWRREILSKFFEKKVSSHRRKTEEKSSISEKTDAFEPEKKGSCRVAVTITDSKQFEIVLSYPQVKRIYFDLFRGKLEDLEEISGKARQNGKEFYICLPHIFRKQTREWLKNKKEYIDGMADGYLVRNLEEIGYLGEMPGKRNIVFDYNIYTWNSSTIKFFREQGIEEYTAPLELNKNELVDIINQNSTIVVYGFFPVMLTAQCFFGGKGSCQEKLGMTIIEDRKKVQFSAVNNCKYCYNVIYSDKALYLPEVVKKIDKLFPEWFRLDFFMENTQQVKNVMDAFFYKEEIGFDKSLYTKGHFRRGVE